MGFNTVINYFVKAGKSIPIHSTLTRLDDIVFEYTDDVYGLIKGNQITKLKNAGAKLQPTQELRATIGDASVWIESHLLDAFPAASQEVKSAFRGLSSVQETMHRPKGALSIFPKVQRGLIEAAENGRDFSSIKEAIRYVDDGIGSRVITRSLDKLSRSQIDDMIRNTMIDGKRISAQDMKILRGYIYSANPEKCSPRAFQLYEQFAQPLIEKRSGEVVDRLTAGILKHRVLNEGLDLQDLCRRGLLDEKWLKIIESNDVLPLNITQINNYRGAHGLPEFTNRQIQQLSRALNTGRGRSLKVLSDVRGLDDFLYSADEVAELSKKSIKTSGYRTAQVKIVHANGALGEIQYRGRLTNMIG